MAALRTGSALAALAALSGAHAQVSCSLTPLWPLPSATAARSLARRPSCPPRAELTLRPCTLHSHGHSCRSPQICNSRDPDSGGVLVPALGFGEEVTCECDVTLGTIETDKEKCAKDYRGNYLDPRVLWMECWSINTTAACGTAQPDKNKKIFSCKWDGAEDKCVPSLDQQWGCMCKEFSGELKDWTENLNSTEISDYYNALPDKADTEECTPAENDPQTGLAVVYCFLLLWSFSGVGIIADVFMEAIAVITSSSTLVETTDKAGEKQQLEIMTWNATVANLTLMALGSSAPEILLSVIEIVSGKFYSGALGPSTIVGSAAFNMLVILGICVMCIPAENAETGETGTRKIADMNVFAITAFSSVFAYVWLLVILMMVTPNVVDLWEALLTFIFFPVLVGLAYMADAGYFSRRNQVVPESSVSGIKQDGQSVGTFRPNEVKSLLKAQGTRGVLSTDVEQLAQAAYYKAKPKTRADYRIEATRELTGSKPRVPEILGDGEGKSRRSWVGWQSTDIKVAEGEEFAECIVERSGNLSYPVTFKVESASGTAAGSPAVSQTLTLKADEDTVACKIPIKSGDTADKQEHFVVTISDPSEKEVEIEKSRTECAITVVDDTTPAALSMAETEEEGMAASYKCYESDGRVLVKVVRTGACKSAVSCQYATKEGTATANMDYKETSGTLEFGPGETSKFIDIEIIDDDQYETDEDFTVTISDPVGCTLGGIKTATVTIVNDDEMTQVVERVANLLKINMDKYKVGSASYSQQFKDAVEMPEGGIGSYIAHFLNLPFKVIFAICPPPGICGGWLCFSISLVLIGVTTAVIGDLAALFGCAVGMKDAVTAITFVALGTSLPDTFASKAAAIGDKTADSSVGNVTGSNSVNVFLGLGLPWLMAAAFWMSSGSKDDWIFYLEQLPDSMLTQAQYADILKMPCADASGCFVVPAGDLGYSVIIFGISAVLCLGGMVLRRQLYGYELGGKASTPFGVFFILLWFWYVVMSTMKSYAII